jgi:HEAT repeat protein
MSRLLDNFDRISFWLGFLAATLFWWLFLRLRPAMVKILHRVADAIRASRLDAATGLETRLCNEMLRQVQGNHFAAPLFSLDELLIPPRLLAPPPPAILGDVPFIEEISLQAIPLSPGRPEIASQYGAPTLTLAEALSKGRNVVIIGQAGSGKSVAIGDLVIQAARREALPGDLHGRIPLLLHVVDIAPFLPIYQEALGQAVESGIINPNSALEILSNAVAARLPAISARRISLYLRQAVFSGRIILLIDGMDELADFAFNHITHYLHSLTAGFPALRIAVAASDTFLGRLVKLGFVPFPLARWTRAQQREFIQKWSRLWTTYIQTTDTSRSTADPLILNAWVESKASMLTPLELTLKLWAAYAGDSLGPGPVEAIEAYLRRQLFTPEDPLNQSARSALEAFAMLALVVEQPVLNPKDATSLAAAEAIEPELLQALPLKQGIGILQTFSGGRVGFTHPILLSYLSACGMEARMLFPQALQRLKWPHPSSWSTRDDALCFLAALLDPDPGVFQSTLEASRPPLHRTTLQVGKWLRYAPEGAGWRPVVMRRLAGLLQDESLPLGLRCSALTDIVLSGTSGLTTMLHQFSRSQNPAQRQLAALGFGMLPEINEIEDLKTLFADPIPNVFRAACLALASIGNHITLEILAEGLLQGEEELRRAAAEALAIDPEEGHPTLREGAALDDLLVRRAVVFGLQRIRQPWSQLILESIATQDSQWVVKNAASQALEQLSRPDPRVPAPQPPLQDIPWLLAFASKKGIGFSSSRAAFEMLVQCMAEGSQEEKLAALQLCASLTDKYFIPSIYQLYHGQPGELVEGAYQALCIYELSGIELPHPEKPGVKYAQTL